MKHKGAHGCLLQKTIVLLPGKAEPANQQQNNKNKVANKNNQGKSKKAFSFSLCV